MKRSDDIAFQRQSPASPLSLFCAAAPTDEAMLDQWETYLLPLQQKHPISCWSARHITAGTNAEQERSFHLGHADLILLLLSADFFASEECLAVMQRALQRQRAGSARVIPLLLRPVEWQETELATLAPLPANGVSVVQWTIQDEAWHACVLGLQPIFRHRLSTFSPAFTSVRVERRAASDRERFLDRLRQIYQELLDRSLQGITWMELGLASKPDAVRNASHLLLRLPQRDEQVLAPGTSILDAYAQAQEELLILGAPGAGKSTLLLDLAVQLVEHAAADETHPLPVILPLSSWAVRRPPLASWLIEQLAHTYDVPRKLSERWMEQEHILPLLDGLDEMEETARAACIAAINTYHGAHLTPLVVCSRQSEYEAAATRERLVLQSAVAVQPLTTEHVETSLRTAGPAFSGLREALHQQQAVRELATTPLMLSVLLLTYQGASLETVAQSDADLEQRVWTDYVARMVQQKGDETWYPLERTSRWLTWLAQQMRVHQQTIFYAEYLYTDWLSSAQQRAMTWLSVRTPVIMLGVLACLLVSIFVSSALDQISPLQIEALDPVSLLQMGLLGGFVGICLSQNIGAGTADVRRHPSASKRAALMSCVLLGVLVAASFGLSLGPDYFLGDWVRDGSITGLGSGLSAWIFQVLLLRIPRQRASIPYKHPSLRWRVSAWFDTVAARHAWLAAIVFGAGMGLGYGLNYGPSLGLHYGLHYGLLYGLSDGLSLGLTALLVSVILDASKGTLRFAERIHWKWQSLLQPRHLCTSIIVAGVSFLLFGLFSGLGYGLGYGLSDGLRNGPIYGLSDGLSLGLSYWLLLGLYRGMVREHIEDQDRHQFNQGVRRSLRNGAFLGLLSACILAGIGVLSYGLSEGLSEGLFYGLGYGLSEGLSYGLFYGLSGLSEGLSYGLSVAWIPLISGFLLIWAISGGLTILRHYVIRGLLARSRRFPWRAQAFLDDATARILLQRVGGGYRFMHRRLLDYFADLDGAATPTSVATDARLRH